MRIRNLHSLGKKIAVSVAATITVLLLIGAGGLIFYNYRLLIENVEKEARNTLTAVAAVHTQSMLERQSAEDGDPAIAVLNGTMEALSRNQPDVKVWMVMGPKLLDYQRRRNSTEVEAGRDAIDQQAIAERREVSVFQGGGIYRLTIPVLLGSGAADYPRCAECHTTLMGIRPGEAIGAYAIAIDWNGMRSDFLHGLWSTAIGTLLIAGLTSWLCARQTNRLAGQPLARMTEVMSALARGDLQAPIPQRTGDDEIGAMAEALIVFRDEALARREAESSVRLLGQTVDQSTSMVVITDPEARIVYVNQAFTATMGYSAAEVLGQNPRIFSAGVTRPATYTDMWERIRHGKPWSGELLDRKKDGGEIWVAASIAPVIDPQGVITHFVSFLQDVSERKQATERAHYLAFHDALTGLPNRALFNDRLTVALAAAERNATQLAVVLLDLDNFTAINDTLGHTTGDLLISAVADRLRGSDTLSRESSSTARLGGDEFAIILTQIDGSRGAAAVADRLCRLFASPFPVGHEHVRAEASLGIALYPVHGSSSSDLLRRADLALHAAKENTKGSYQFFNLDLESAAIARVGLEYELAEAIDRKQLWLAYQPQVDPHTNTVCGFEALLRWTHPVRGLVSPATFIPVAEASRLIVRIGYWVIEEACRQMARWRQDGLTLVPVAVNLSPLQIGEIDLVRRIGEIREKYCIPAELLPLEITESSFLKQSEAVSLLMSELTSRGHAFNLDDFGTGYSSLSYLARFPFKKIKLDRAFIRNIHQSPGNRAIVRATVALGHELGMRVNAEGVEQAEELAIAISSGVDEIQGYYYSVPLRPEEVPDFIDSCARRVTDTTAPAGPAPTAA
ncbi:MAG TPA: EAL domain-containing protein [Rhodocyclaceae bacterium]|nr:EAL domain-containing protein [Rhodocyclaceae bacterium]